MGRPRLKPGTPETAARLLAAGEREFARAGFHGARLEDIAARAGIRRPSLLHHFPTKRALYRAVVRETFESLGKALSIAMAAPGDFPERIQGVTQAFSDFLERRPAVAALILREFLDGGGPDKSVLLGEAKPVLDRVEAYLAAAARELRPGLPVRAAVLQVTAGVLLRASAGTLRRPLWGERKDRSGLLAGLLIARRPA